MRLPHGDLDMKMLEKLTFGMGDRFAHQGTAQLSAVMEAASLGIPLVPVWNKSNREHAIIGTEPRDLRREADDAVTSLGWNNSYYVDADHIGLATVDRFLEASDFFTIDVADFSGKAAPAQDIESFVKKHANLQRGVKLPGGNLNMDAALMRKVAEKYLRAMQEAGRIYRHVAGKKSHHAFAVEVSVDETDSPQSPVELLLILAMIADEGIPAQTIAPKFSGRFNKGVDYVGDLAQFEKEFDEDLAVLAFAVREYQLPGSLKLSIHSGSDKFSLYPAINRLIKKHGAGLHVKTAGTTWLEEVIGLAEAGGEGLRIAKDIYLRALPRFDELVAPYAPVVDIRPAKLPKPEDVEKWTSAQYVSTLRHEQACAGYNADFRQFIHVSFKIAAEMELRYTDGLKAHRDIISRNVKHNILRRHILPLFG